jgi:hypothetical protein
VDEVKNYARTVILADPMTISDDQRTETALFKVITGVRRKTPR